MSSILAIETSTDACSVALYRDGAVDQRLEIKPRQHNRLLFAMLEEILPAGKLQELDAIAFGNGPGSFTGLRVACSAVQGLAFAADLPCIGVSTLACQAQGALRRGLLSEGDRVISLIDARVKEIYAGAYRIDAGLAVEIEAAVAVPPDSLSVEDNSQPAIAIGNGLVFEEQLPPDLRVQLSACHPDVLPEARDLLPLALDALGRGAVQAAADAVPVYVRDEISWKKLAEQGANK